VAVRPTELKSGRGGFGPKTLLPPRWAVPTLAAMSKPALGRGLGALLGGAPKPSPAPAKRTRPKGKKKL